VTKSQLFVVDNHPAIPPSDLLKKWEDKWFDEEEHADVLLIQAYQAGADEELEACCEWLQDPDLNVDTYKLRAFRRPKPPSLKEQALAELAEWENIMDIAPDSSIRRALEQLDA
jgi:hypothetical protein